MQWSLTGGAAPQSHLTHSELNILIFIDRSLIFWDSNGWAYRNNPYTSTPIIKYQNLFCDKNFIHNMTYSVIKDYCIASAKQNTVKQQGIEGKGTYCPLKSIKNSLVCLWLYRTHYHVPDEQHSSGGLLCTYRKKLPVN